MPPASTAPAHDHEPAGDLGASTDFTPGAPFVEPEVRRSANGELNTTLRMRYAYRDLGGYRLYMRTYEGASPGPTLRLKPGDVLRIKLINDMPPNRDLAPVDHSLPHDFNTTNLHTHGLHVSPSGISDNVMRIMEPGESYDIEIAIPSDHIPGTNWYHPHAHGSADVQIASGAVGALIIEGDFADVPEIAAAKERLLVLTEAVFDRFGMVEDFATLFPETAARFFAVNGVREPTITMRPGEVQRWRILHAGWQDDLFLDLEGHTLNSIARDGIPLSRMGQSCSNQARSAHRLSECHADGARPTDRRVGAGGRARNLRVARRPLRSRLCLADRADRPAGDRRRSAAHEPPRQTSGAAGEADRR